MRIDNAQGSEAPRPGGAEIGNYWGVDCEEFCDFCSSDPERTATHGLSVTRSLPRSNLDGFRYDGCEIAVAIHRFDTLCGVKISSRQFALGSFRIELL